MQAFHNSQTIKTERLLRVQNHMDADNLVRGATGQGGKGCAVWCTLDAYNHASYETELGIPEWLARVEDTLFEGMSIKKSRTWPRVFLEAINVGADLEKAKAQFLLMVLRSTLDTFDHDKFPAVLAAVNGSIALWERDDIGSPDWNRAAAEAAAEAVEAAEAAAEAVEAAAEAVEAAEAAAEAVEAAEAAAEAVEAARAAWAAWAAAEAAAAEAAAEAARAARAAWAAAEAARAAAEAAEAAAKYDSFADGLLDILRDLK